MKNLHNADNYQTLLDLEFGWCHLHRSLVMAFYKWKNYLICSFYNLNFCFSQVDVWTLIHNTYYHQISSLKLVDITFGIFGLFPFENYLQALEFIISLKSCNRLFHIDFEFWKLKVTCASGMLTLIKMAVKYKASVILMCFFDSFFYL